MVGAKKIQRLKKQKNIGKVRYITSYPTSFKKKSKIY